MLGNYLQQTTSAYDIFRCIFFLALYGLRSSLNGPQMRLTLKEQSSLSVGCFVRGGKNDVGCYVRGDKNSMGCYVRGDKNSMGCFVRGGKSLWDVLSGVAKNGMGCFVPGCFVRLPIKYTKFLLVNSMNFFTCFYHTMAIVASSQQI